MVGKNITKIITVALNLLAVIFYIITTVERSTFSQIYKRTSMIFANFIKRKWKKGGLRFDNDDNDVDELEADIILRLEKPNLAEIENGFRGKIKKLTMKYKCTMAIIHTIIVFLMQVLYGNITLSIVLFVVNATIIALKKPRLAVLLSLFGGRTSILLKTWACVLLIPEYFNITLPNWIEVVIGFSGLCISLEPVIGLRNETRKSWATLDNKVKNEYYNIKNIDTYWSNLGLNNKPSNAVVVQATSPDFPKQRERECLRLTNDVIPFEKTLKQKSDLFYLAIMSDSHHVLSLNKRVLGAKSDLNLSFCDTFIRIMGETYQNAEYINISKRQSVIKALSTPGSAGEFAKMTTLEPIWKDSTIPLIIKTWIKIMDIILYECAINGKIPQFAIDYRLYRKIEILPFTDEMTHKITRLMNAPNLIARVVDNWVFYPFNESMIINRFNIIPKLGLNITLDISEIIPHYGHWVGFLCDFTDYDGTQHAYQMFGCLIVRIKHLINNRSILTEDEFIMKYYYLIKRYEKHIFRDVRSNDGILLHMIGQQASGDITTSDDNSLRSSAYLILVMARINVSVNDLTRLEIIRIGASGDDTWLFLNKHYFSKQFVSQVPESMEYISKQLGWKLKMIDFYDSDRKEETVSPDVLSHHIQTSLVVDKNFNEYKIQTVKRNEQKTWAKWDFSPNQTSKLSNEKCYKLSTKMLSFMTCLFGNTALYFHSLRVLLKVRSGICKMNTDTYSWRNIEKIGINCLDLNNLCESQTSYKWEDLTFLEIQEEDLEETKNALNMIKIETNITIIILTQNKKYFVNFSKLKYNISKFMDQELKKGLVKTKSESVNWWNEILIKPFESTQEANMDESTIKEKITTKTAKTSVYKLNLHLCKHTQKQFNKTKFNNNYNTINVFCNKCYIIKTKTNIIGRVIIVNYRNQ